LIGINRRGVADSPVTINFSPQCTNDVVRLR